MAEQESFFKRITSIYTDKSINGWVRGAAWVGTAAVLYIIGNGIVNAINAGRAAQEQATRQKELDDLINKLENPTDPTVTEPQQPTFTDVQYSNFANAITAAFTGSHIGNIASAVLIGILTSAGDTVYNILKQMENDVDMYMLQKAFGIRTITKSWLTPDYTNVDLVTAVNDQLDIQEIAFLNSYLEKKGIKFRF